MTARRSMTMGEAIERVERIGPYAPLVTPADWEPFPAGQSYGLDDPWGAGWRHVRAPLTVLLSCKRELDGRLWLHLSISHLRRMPTWEELGEVKDVFIGRDRMAVQVFARAAEHCNEHPRCLHLWCCLDADPTPDFRVEGRI